MIMTMQSIMVSSLGDGHFTHTTLPPKGVGEMLATGIGPVFKIAHS